ncbi:MAG TPA: PAAR domain-containing protein [Chitinophagaceae bacterium]|nr:PAAR domain-containing protein [Chitinophagaceae bacterium]
MKRLAAGLLLLAVLPFNSFSQQEYKGSVSLIPKGPDFNAAYYTNKLSMKVDAGGTAVLTANLRFGPRSEPGDYIAFTGSISGTLQEGELSLSGSLNQAMQDGKRFVEEAVTTRVTGQQEGDKITGTFYMRYDGKEESTMTFTLNPGEVAPELLFPLGSSPKIFDRGWLFGASFKITGKDNEEVDLTDKIEWSGTASFEPDKGSSSRPVFNTIGENKIILTAEYEGKKYSKEYKVTTVSSSLYAHIGSMAFCPADADGCPACPHPVTGPVITGNGNVLIDGMPVACEGDRGVHAGCCGSNNFVITGGDPEVIINGKKAAKIGSATQHCGGNGHIVSTGGGVNTRDSYMALSDDISITKNGQKLPKKGKPQAGTTIKTGPKGLLVMSPDQNTVMMIMPNTGAVIAGAGGNDLVIEVIEGALFVNGEKTDNNKNLVIETLTEKLVKKGTRFLFSYSKDSSRLIVYEGEVEVTLKKENRTVLVPAGKVYFNNFKNPYTVADTLQFQSASELMKIPKDSAYWQLPKDEAITKEATSNQTTGFLEMIKKYWYFAAGGLVLILLMVYLGKRKKA